jgi:UDP-2,4-diacetamido-2,4,6-trideoxy-beta-L-altropyranose hydrolase
LIHEGFKFVRIETPYPDERDLKDTLDSVLKIQRGEHSRDPSWFVLDGYHFDSAYQKAIKGAGLPLLVLDDMGHLLRYHADILLNTGIGATQSLYPRPGKGQLLLGLKYVLLREEFLRWGKVNKEIPGEAGKILVTLGGADSKNVTSRILEALSQIRTVQIRTKIVVGSVNPHAGHLKRKAASAGSRFEILEQVDHMIDLMAWSDLAIAGAGSTCCELAYMGVPSLLVVLSENQKRLAEGMDGKCAVNIGDEKNLDWDKVAHAVEDLILDQAKRKRMSDEGRDLVDGLGADRVVDEMMKTIHRGTETSWQMS